MDKVFLRCPSCRAVNRLPKEKIRSRPVCGECKTPLAYPVVPVNASSYNYANEVESFPGAVLVDFWSPTCGYCLRLSPVLEELAREKAGILKIVKIDVSKESVLAGRFNITGVPYLILYSGGKRMADLPGAVPKDELLGWIVSHLGAL